MLESKAEAQTSAPSPATPAKPPVEGHSARRIHRVAEHVGARSYLEIGVFNGKTFNGVNLPNKVGVDPRFAFDIEPHKRDGVRFVSLTSDAFFSGMKSPEHFDIIFLDGLHTFQQTFRDFCNSLICSHDRTVWLIDDVFPSDVYSAWPVASEARQFRKLSGSDSPAWNGDVYKLLFAIHDFFPVLSFVSFSNRGNRQTLLWKTPRQTFTPILGSLERIERLGYFELMKSQQVFNFKPEDEAFAEFFSSMNGKFTVPDVPETTSP